MCQKKNHMRYVDLFCGAGGGTCGLCVLDWQCVGAYDSDKDAVDTYARNFPSHPVSVHDLSDPVPHTSPVDLVIGGPPCQDFTTTCDERVCRMKRRARLTLSFAQRCLELAPRWIIFENVRFSAKKLEVAQMRSALETGGYFTVGRVVNTRSIGMTQPRYRFIVLAHRDARCVCRAWEAFDALVALCGPPPTLRATLATHGIHEEKSHCYYPVPRTDERQPSVFSVDSADGPYFTVRARTRPMPSTYVFRERDSTQDAVQVFDFRTRHAKALQQFPVDFQLPRSGVTADRLLGNAIPPPLVTLLARAIDAADLSQ